MSRIIKEIAYNFGQVANDMGNFQNAGLLKRWSETLEQSFTQNILQVDIYISEAVWTNKSDEFWRVYKSSMNCSSEILGGQIDYRIIHGDVLPVRKENDLFGALALIVLDTTIDRHPNLLDLIRKSAHPFSLILLHGGEDITGIRRLLHPGGVMELQLEDWAQKIFPDMISSVYNESELQLMLEISALRSFSPLVDILSDAIAHENKLLVARRTMIAQEGNFIKKEESKLNLNELNNQVRSSIQQLFNEIDREIKLKYDDYNRPVTGKFSKISIDAATKINDLETSNLAEKAEKIALSIKGSLLEGILNSCKKELVASFTADLQATNDRFSSLSAEVQSRLREKIPGSFSWQINSCEVSYKATIDSYTVYNKYYSGEMTKAGVMEYFISIRDYVGIIMVAVGLFAPLAYSFQLFDLFSDEKSSLSSNMRVGIMGVAGALSAVLMVYGFFDLRKRIPLRRKEERERELNKARELISAEVKKIFAEASRDWVNLMSGWLRDSQNSINSKTDRLLREAASELQRNVVDQRGEMQKINMGIENMQRRLTSVQSTYDQIRKRHSDLSDEARKKMDTTRNNTPS